MSLATWRLFTLGDASQQTKEMLDSALAAVTRDDPTAARSILFGLRDAIDRVDRDPWLAYAQALAHLTVARAWTARPGAPALTALRLDARAQHLETAQRLTARFDPLECDSPAMAALRCGLLEIDPSSQALNTPMLIMNYDELDYVMDAMKPEFEKKIEEKGYIVLAWSDAGWARLFSKEPLTSPADAGKLKIFSWEGDPGAVKMFKSAGFNPVVVAATDTRLGSVSFLARSLR